MINWLELFSYAIIIVPLSFLTALLSIAWHRARVSGVPVRQQLESKASTITIYTCGLIIAVRMVVFSDITWQRVVWGAAGLLMVYWLIDMLRADRKSAKEHAS